MATSIAQVARESLKDFIALLYPDFCPGCDEVLQNHEKVICTSCRINLPRTNFRFKNQNQIEKLFWGKVEVKKATAFLQFHKDSEVMNLLHHLKYRNNEEVGLAVGRMFASEFINSDFFADIDVIVPVPLHKSKVKERGYNQCDSICNGISEITGIKSVHSALKRTRSNDSQTRKSRFDRWINVKSLFELNKSLAQDSHVLLIDDVVTTGSTLESCASTLIKGGCKVSIAAMAAPID